MRIWDLNPKSLCRLHLLGEHRELHAIWSILTKHKKGYSKHPETLRWQGKLKALYSRHTHQVREFNRRGYRHQSPLRKKLARGRARQNYYLTSLKNQRRLLKNKPCPCFQK
ncbi:MAG: pyrimidine dimer DNA glycosylase/endonuclease V [Patescibacteria group bacterium]